METTVDCKYGIITGVAEFLEAAAIQLSIEGMNGSAAMSTGA